MIALGHYARMMKRFVWCAFLALILATGEPGLPRAEEACRAPEPVCAAAEGVFIVAAFDPFASAVRISATRLVTTRHGIADETTVKVMLKDGSTLDGTVVPNGYDGDLILLEVPGLPDGRVLPLAESIEKGARLYTVAGDDGRKAVRVYPPGEVLLLPSDASPQGRLHHTAYSQFGNSGGALVDDQGRLVGIIASGGEGRFEAIPVSEIAHLSELSGDAFAAQSRSVGEAVRECTLLPGGASRASRRRPWRRRSPAPAGKPPTGSFTTSPRRRSGAASSSPAPSSCPAPRWREIRIPSMPG